MDSNDLGAVGRRPLPPKPDLPDVAAAHRRGPADAVEARWRQLALVWQWRRERQEVLRPGVGYPGVVHLIEVARAERTLRRLYPYTSHFALHLSSCTRYPYALRVPSVLPRHDGRFQVFVPRGGTLLGETDTAEAAVALVVAHLPAGLGPAVAGTADDLCR
ncbi:DUF6193 family natural product biosynthesis protein [Streptomyces sp. RLB1-33]|uniref:DUF6193 family natural product biosynthesis protein n=1 Tax=Streptomyces mirabilis TaxID=68239 RepID=UPI00143E8354|nr:MULTISPECIES: DUF6193 family natural product biosynthesis protein [Streptomyces]QIY72817.1 hypothetical protein HEP84_30425 [Streptomyces sp. RLB1-33]QUW80223.1 hypothetical protein SMIR_14695 [Streptomyces mirabilis]